MKTKDLFHGFNIIGFNTNSRYLSEDSGQIVTLNLNNDSIFIHLKRDLDSTEGDSVLRLNDKFKHEEKEIFDWILNNEKKIIGMTLGQLRELEINLE